MLKSMKILPALVLAAAGTAAWSDVGHDEEADIGQTGNISHIDQVISVDMGEMWFKPEEYDIVRGATVKFIVGNSGRMVHEFNIGTDAMQDAHEAEMKLMTREGMMTPRKLFHDKMRTAGMMHNDANSVLLEPGESSEIIWTFSGAAEDILIACNVPGHRRAGMEASINLIGDVGHDS